MLFNFIFYLLQINFPIGTKRFNKVNLLKFSACKSTIAYVIVNSYALNFNKFVNWNDKEFWAILETF